MSCDFIGLAMQGVQGLHPYQPGKPVEELERELGLTKISKLASNENPLGPSPKVLQVLSDIAPEIARYPDGNGFALKTALAAHHSVDAESITLGNGSNDVLDLIARAYLGEGREAVFSQYAFAVYPISTQAVGAKCVMVPANPPEHSMPLGHALDAMLQAITAQTRVVFIANPNNPTGTWLEADVLQGFLESVPNDVLVVLDEAYLEYGSAEERVDGSQWLGQFKNLVITRTFSKIYGLAGLRVGYALSHPDVANVLNRVRQPFNVNLPALAAAEVALSDIEHVEKTAELNRRGMVQLQEALKVLGLKWLPSRGNFLAVDMGQDAGPLFQGLLEEGVIVRPIGAYGMPNYLRISIGSEDENAHCIQALRKICLSD